LPGGALLPAAGRLAQPGGAGAGLGSCLALDVALRVLPPAGLAPGEPSPAARSLTPDERGGPGRRCQCRVPPAGPRRRVGPNPGPGNGRTPAVPDGSPTPGALGGEAGEPARG